MQCQSINKKCTLFYFELAKTTCQYANKYRVLKSFNFRTPRDVSALVSITYEIKRGGRDVTDGEEEVKSSVKI
jgi:hypothetical protein